MSSWHTMHAEEAVHRLRADAVAGLSSAEAARRLAEAGPNELPSSVAIPAWKILLRQFKSILIVILLIAIVLSLALGHLLETAGIAVIALFTVALGFVQEYRADRALEALRRMAAPTATVLRDGEEREVPAREVVPGDILFLCAGGLVPADGRLIEAANLQIDEASLTGESSPAEKSDENLDGEDIALGDRRNMVYSSTVVTYGRGRVAVAATGAGTEVGRIGRLLEAVTAPQTPLERQTDALGKTLVRGSLAIVAVVVALGILRGLPFVEILLFGIAFAVAVVPEALPAVVTISLAIGARLMAKRNALIRRLPAVETLGCASVICSDKTGTLTTGEMTVREIVTGGNLLTVTGAGYDPGGTFLKAGSAAGPDEPLRALLRAAALCSDADLLEDRNSGRWRVRGDPTEAALVVAAAKGGFRKTALEAENPRRGEIPFSPERKRMTTLHEAEGEMSAFSKGAPEIVLESCTRWRTVRGDEPLTASERANILGRAHDMADRALRILAVSEKRGAALDDAEKEMTFLGLFGMIDPPRPEAREAIETCNQAGIRPVMITGDHPATARAIGRELGILREGRVVTGADLDAMSNVSLENDIESFEVFARVSPEHKLRVVSALQKKGHVVAMTGDGVNDAPALKKADIGVAMGLTGTDVAKEAAEAVTMTFVSLVLIQFFKAYIFRSERHSLLQRPFANRWLNLAVGWELLLLVAIVYVPALQKLFGTFALSPADWLVILPAALSVFPVLEAAKYARRAGWIGADPA